MKDFFEVSFDVNRFIQELSEFGELLKPEKDLVERRQVKPFFEKRKHLSSFLGGYMALGPANRLAHEFEIAGDFQADLVVGNREKQTYCMVEFEAGGSKSIFTQSAKKSTKEWSRSFEHGFSQLVDWFRALDDLKNTNKFREKFGDGHTTFYGLLVIGRDSGLTPSDLSRLKWRSEHVVVNSHQIKCVTYDEMHRDFLSWPKQYLPRIVTG